MLIGSGAKVLGPFRVGNGARVAAGAVVLDAVPDNATAVGVPARVVSVNGVRTSCTKTLDQIHVADPVSQELCRLRFEYDKLKQQMEGKLNSKCRPCCQRKSIWKPRMQSRLCQNPMTRTVPTNCCDLQRFIWRAARRGTEAIGSSSRK